METKIKANYEYTKRRLKWIIYQKNAQNRYVTGNFKSTWNSMYVKYYCFLISVNLINMNSRCYIGYEIYIG
jgi:hypothetical protein